MNRNSRSTLFLMEQLIVTAVFAICAAACVRILVASYFMATETRDMSNAITAAETGAECFKAVSGDIGKVAQIFGGNPISADGSVVVYYDKEWLECSEEHAAYRLRLVREDPAVGSAMLISGEITVERLDGEVILIIPVAARGARQ